MKVQPLPDDSHSHLLDRKSGAEMGSRLWEVLLHPPFDRSSIHEPVTGHPNVIHETLGGQEVTPFRQALVTELKVRFQQNKSQYF